MTTSIKILLMAVVTYCYVEGKGGEKPLQAYGPHYLLHESTHKGAANKQKTENTEDDHNVENDNKVQYWLRVVPYNPQWV